MKLLNALGLLLFSLYCAAQTPLTLTCPISVKAGIALICTISLTNNQGTAALQYTVTAPTSLGPLTAVSTGSAASASKGLTQVGTSIIQGGFGPPAPGTLNSALMPDGVIANLSWQIPSGLANQTVQISLVGGNLPAVAVTTSGSLIPITPNPPQSVAVLPSTNLCDINGDGQIDQADVTAQLSLVTTFPQSSKCARNANGCNVGAVEIVAVAASGGACTATQ